jgi:hypothetical protein
MDSLARYEVGFSRTDRFVRARYCGSTPDLLDRIEVAKTATASAPLRVARCKTDHIGDLRSVSLPCFDAAQGHLGASRQIGVNYPLAIVHGVAGDRCDLRSGGSSLREAYDACASQVATLAMLSSRLGSNAVLRPALLEQTSCDLPVQPADHNIPLPGEIPIGLPTRRSAFGSARRSRIIGARRE